MSRLVDLTGQKINKLLIISRSSKKGKSNNSVFWNCICDCGKKVVIRGDSIRGNYTKACGCRIPIVAKERNTNHGLSRHRLYHVWTGMRSRCNNPNTPEYKYYGLKGICVCSEWNDFRVFLNDMGNTYIEGLTIDRIDSNGNYNKENCRWADNITQNNNRDFCKKYNYNNEWLTIAELARKYSINYQTLRNRIRNNWELAIALETKPKIYKTL